jgi:hypothetical protein
MTTPSREYWPKSQLRLIHTCQAAPMPFSCRSPAMPCHDAPLPFSDSAVSFAEVRMVAGNIRTASPTDWYATFVELRVVAGRSQTRTGRPHAVSGRPMLIHTCHAMPMPRCAVALRTRFHNGMVAAWHDMCESNTAALCKSNGKDTI